MHYLPYRKNDIDTIFFMRLHLILLMTNIDTKHSAKNSKIITGVHKFGSKRKRKKAEGLKFLFNFLHICFLMEAAILNECVTCQIYFRVVNRGKDRSVKRKSPNIPPIDSKQIWEAGTAVHTLLCYYLFSCLVFSAKTQLLNIMKTQNLAHILVRFFMIYYLLFYCSN